MSEEIAITLTADEWLVFFEWLARINNLERHELFEDQAEQRVLWNVEAALEGCLPGLLSGDYASRLADARARVRDVSEAAGEG